MLNVGRGIRLIACAGFVGKPLDLDECGCTTAAAMLSEAVFMSLCFDSHGNQGNMVGRIGRTQGGETKSRLCFRVMAGVPSSLCGSPSPTAGE